MIRKKLIMMVCIKPNYYCVLNNVAEVELSITPIQKVGLFKYDWFDSWDRRVRIHPQYKLVELHKEQRYRAYDPFILAH